jgi:deazaflavin-dependent oxidoreductase (nitroreductase family)
MIETNAGTNKPPKISGFQKFGLAMQVFLLRRGWMGPASNFLMVITTKGRKTGREATIPISYKRDGNDLIGLNPGNSNWFRNVLVSKEATLEVQGEKIKVNAQLVEDKSERQRIFNLYKDDANIFQRIFKVSVTAPEEELQRELKKWQFVRFSKR